MKTKLSFFTVKSQGNKFLVFFSSDDGNVRNTAYNVKVEIHSKTKSLIAELAVIRHVLLNSEAGHIRSDEDICIQCSQGAIKKLIKKRSTKSDAQPFARFLLTRYPEINVTVKHDKSMIEANTIIKDLTVDSIPEETEETNIGTVKLTEHAIARFHKRFHADKTLGKAASILVDTLRYKKMSVLNVNNKKRTRSIIKHHTDAEYWSTGDDCFVTVPEQSHRVLVTVLPRQTY